MATLNCMLFAMVISKVVPQLSVKSLYTSLKEALSLS